MKKDGPNSAEASSPAAGASQETRPRRWLEWTLFVAFAVIAFECVLLAIVMRGPWLILLAPGLVCAYRAVEQRRELQGGTKKV